jgi:hypothetical protein
MFIQIGLMLRRRLDKDGAEARMRKMSMRMKALMFEFVSLLFGTDVK